MADILLSFGAATTDGDVSEIRKGLETIITQIERNPPKVRVGLTVDNDALQHFKKELEAILNTVSLANGAPITLNISGLGEISTQATQAKKSLDSVKKAGSGTGTAFNDAKKAINGYFKALADVDKRLGRDIYFDFDTGKWSSTTKEFQYLADALTEAEQRFNSFASAEARSKLSVEQQAELVRIETDAYNKYGVSVEDAWKKVQIAADRAQAAADKSATQAALKAESMAYEEAAAAVTKYYSILTKVNTGDNDISFDGTKFVSKSGNYDELAASLTKAADAYRLVRESASSLSDDSQVQLLQLISQEVQKYNVAVEQKANKDRQAAEAAAEAAAAEARKREAYLSSAEAVNSQISRLDTIINQTESNLQKWTQARGGKSSENYKAIEREVEALKQMRSQIASTGRAMGDFNGRVGNSTATIKENSRAIKDAEENTKSLSDKWGGLAAKFGSWLTVSQAIMAAIRTVKKMVSTVVELDTAMTELKKVTNESDSTYNRFLTTAVSRAKELGVALTDVVNATADFARLGYGIEDASKLADAALVYKNVGDGIQDISQASESIVSTMQAFQIDPSNVMHIVDVFNSIGNNFAISSGGIGDALQRSSAAMHAAGNTLEETAALIAAGNTVLQNPDIMGTTLKTVSMFLRAAKTEAEDAGESTDGMANSVSELRQEILRLTGQRVDIQIDEDNFKNTYQILKELSQVWEDLTDVSKANILEMIAGKRNANAVSAILQNFEIAEEALAVATNSTGSALKENEVFLDSIQGKINQFSSAWQALSNTMVDSGLVKRIIDFGTALLNAANWIGETLGGFGSLEVVILSLVAAYQKFGKVKSILDGIGKPLTSLVGGAKRCPF